MLAKCARARSLNTFASRKCCSRIDAWSSGAGNLPKTRLYEHFGDSFLFARESGAISVGLPPGVSPKATASLGRTYQRLADPQKRPSARRIIEVFG